MSSIRFFRTFVTVVQTGSFAAAATQVALTPAAVSQQMRALEADLGCRLFERNGRTSVLTEEAYQVLPYAQRLLGTYDELRRRNDSSSAVVGCLRVGCVATSMGLLVRTVLSLRARYPRLEIKPALDYTADLLMKLEDGAIDAAVVARYPHRGTEGVLWTPLYAEPLVFVCSSRVPPEATMAQLLADRPFLRQTRDTPAGVLVDRYLRYRRLRPTDLLEINSVRVAVELARQDMGVTIVPLARESPWADDPLLRIQRLEGRTALRQVGFAEIPARSPLSSILRRALLETRDAWDAGTLPGGPPAHPSPALG